MHPRRGVQRMQLFARQPEHEFDSDCRLISIDHACLRRVVSILVTGVLDIDPDLRDALWRATLPTVPRLVVLSSEQIPALRAHLGYVPARAA